MLRRSFASILARSTPSGPPTFPLAAVAAFVLPSSSPSPRCWSTHQHQQHQQQQQRTRSIPTTTIPIPIVIVSRQRSTRSTRGLYDGRDVRFGNNVPFSMKKTRRRWDPNLQYKRVYSEVLDEMVRFHLTTGTLRTIDKMGGLDEYLLRSRHVSTKGEGEGQRIRNRIVQKMTHREGLKKKAIDVGESVEDWDKIVLVGKKIRQQQQQPPSSSSSSGAESAAMEGS